MSLANGLKVGLAVRPLHLAMLIGVMVIWGLNFVVAKTGLEQLPPMLLVALRFGLVALVLVPFVPRPTGHWREILAISFTLGFVHFALMFTGLTGIDAATAAIIIQLQVPFASILAAFAFGDMLGWRRLLGMVTAFAGVAIVAGEPRLEGQYLYLAMVLAASMCWSVANIQIKRLQGVSGMTLNAWLGVFATPQLLLGSLLLEEDQWQALANADWRILMTVVYQAIAVVVIGYGTWTWLLRQYDVNQAMPFTLLVTPIGVLAGVLFLGEPLTWALVFGGLMTVVGVGIILVRRPRTTAPEAERV